MIHLPYTDIQPGVIKNNVGMMIMYDGLTWMEHFTSNGELPKYSLPDTVLMTLCYYIETWFIKVI